MEWFGMSNHHKSQRGVVLFIALIVMVAMSLGGVALVRSVDTTTAIVGNLGLREASIAPAGAGLEDAIAALYENNAIPDRDHDLPARSYYASRQSGEDARGVPLTLQTRSLYPQDARVLDTDTGNCIRYIIDRLCTGAGPATVVNCNLVSASSAASVHAPPATPPAPVAAFRITVRVDGPQNTVSHVQMMLRDSAPPRRLSWRVLGE
jgi:Tfp pilus assembly protein PilX